ncbi:unnamed protein product [Cuscuta europaea]|uniref:Uncharacterized protein n=1 Tax=Cuscuta europaea TaxID=41803 RepID=A0A9P0YVZ4_CUSEU|nr:unnamed protein product [Cuscuta europaea]
MLDAFRNCKIIYPPRLNLSSYNPSCHMMDFILHHMNSVLVENLSFRSASPSYHPYILRLYFGILFWIQSLRAGFHVSALSCDQHQFLTLFLSNNPPETLPIASPLLLLFKTLCSSRPELSNYGKVYPRLPVNPGPERRSQFLKDSLESYFLPNIPGIFALLEHLNGEVNGQEPRYPAKGDHFPVREGAGESVLFGHHSFPVVEERTEFEKWSLISPGLQYPCEADRKLNEAFAERYDDFDFPATAADDDLSKYNSYFSMKDSMAWFVQVKNVGGVVAGFFEGSGTLADCEPSCDGGWMVANQITVEIIRGGIAPPPAPTQSADVRSLYEFSFKLETCARKLPPLAEAVAACAQTHIRMFGDHPMFAGFGEVKPRDGPLWEIRPIESSAVDRSSYLSIGTVVARMMKTNSPA